MKWFKRNAALVIGLVICILLGVYAVGCESTGASVMNPGEKVTARQLEVEAESLLALHEQNLAMLELSIEDIHRQDAIKQKLFEFGSTVATTGEFNPVGLIGLAGWVLGASSFANGRKKDTIIARDKTLLNKS